MVGQIVTDTVQISIGLDDAHRDTAAAIFYAAFEQKLAPIFRDETRARQVFARSFNGDYALVATVDGQLAGIAGFKDAHGDMLNLQSQIMTDTFGFFGGWRRLLLMAIFERKLEPGILLMDTISVAPEMRGRGVGTKLLDAVINLARERGYTQVRLDVVDTNPRARKLYERKGFVAMTTESYPFTNWFFGFSGATTMYRTIESA